MIIVFFVNMENNPLVKLEAKLGLSPSPIERIFGIKSFFSGMTEGVHQIANLNFYNAIQANIFSPIIVLLFIYFWITWDIPKIDTRKKEVTFFSVFILCSVVVNLVNK